MEIKHHNWGVSIRHSDWLLLLKQLACRLIKKHQTVVNCYSDLLVKAQYLYLDERQEEIYICSVYIKGQWYSDTQWQA